MCVVSVVCCVLSGRGQCNELIARPEESYRLWFVVVCDLETSRMRGPWSELGRSATRKKKKEHYNLLGLHGVAKVGWFMSNKRKGRKLFLI